MAKIKKALIPAAGFGTRFLPQTKAMPKEMMPLVDKPIIQRVVEELVDGGIETIVIVTGWNKRSIEDHFDNNFELEEKLLSSGKTEALEMVRKISDLAEFVYVRQKGPQGNATPILNAKHIMGNDPFMLFFGDDFIDATPSRARQLIEAYEKYGSTILAAGKVKSEGDYKKYGFVGGDYVEDGVLRVKSIVEKPGSSSASPSDTTVMSGYIFTPDIYEPLEKAEKTLEEGQELVYTFGVQALIDQGIPVHAVEIKDAIYRDTGNKLEYLKTIIEYGLKHEDIGDDFRNFLENLIMEERS
ncbi:UTP--glucose-1-phosphate uridylyltransferase [Candidatus Daviesbacteria bacterium]|nr:UTP--glucose-1-phosphate uridylyltransferase [Candidatus Daviesbacteria bacterium]